jgi:response regulator RpfG family c-di-GMP phosphodiesterase
VRAIGLGAFLHDIGAVEPFGNPNVQELSHLHESRAEGLWREHPKLGLQKLESTQNLSQEVRWILYQHHEEPGGKGFPNGLDTREGKRTIYRGALLVGAIDSFVCKMFGRVDAEASAVLDQMSTEPERWDPLYLKLLKMLFERKNASTRKRAS